MAEVFLAIGYETVVAMIPDRELGSRSYGMADRYGTDVQNVVFTVTEDRPQMLAEEFERIAAAAERDPSRLDVAIAELEPSWNVAPTDRVPAVAQRRDNVVEMIVRYMRADRA